MKNFTNDSLVLEDIVRWVQNAYGVDISEFQFDPGENICFLSKYEWSYTQKNDAVALLLLLEEWEDRTGEQLRRQSGELDEPTLAPRKNADPIKVLSLFGAEDAIRRDHQDAKVAQLMPRVDVEQVTRLAQEHAALRDKTDNMNKVLDDLGIG